MTTAEAGTKLMTDTASFCNSLGNFLGQTICICARTEMIAELLEHAGDFINDKLEKLFKAATNLPGLAALEQGLGDDAINAGLRPLLDKHAGNLEHIRNLEIAGGALGIVFSVANGARGVLEFGRNHQMREKVKAVENRFTHALNALQEKAQAGKEVVSRFLSATKRRAKAAWWACLGGVSRVLGAIGSFILNVLSLCSVATGPASGVLGGVVLLSYFIRDRMQAYHERRARRIDNELNNAVHAALTTGGHASHDDALVKDLKALMDREKLLDLAQQTGGADCRKQVENIIPQEGNHLDTIKLHFKRILAIILGPTKMERSEVLLESGNGRLQLQGMVDRLAAAPCAQFAGKALPPKDFKEPDLGGADPDKRLKRNDADKAIFAANQGVFPGLMEDKARGLRARATTHLKTTFGEARTTQVLALAKGLKANGKLMTFWWRRPTEACKDLSGALKSDGHRLKPQTLARAFHKNSSLIADCLFSNQDDHNYLKNLLDRLDTDAKRQSLREMTRLMGNASNKFTDVRNLVVRLESASFGAGEDIFMAAAMLHGLNTEEARRAWDNLPSTKKGATQYLTQFNRDKQDAEKKAAEDQNAARKNARIPEKWHKHPPAAGTIKSHIEKLSRKDPQDAQIQAMRDHLTEGRGHSISDKAWNDAMKTTSEEDFLLRLAGEVHLHNSALHQLKARQLAAVLNTENASAIAELRMPGESQGVTKLQFSRFVRNEAFDHKPSRLVNIVTAIESRDTQRLKKLIRALPTSSAPGHPLKTLALALFLTHPEENFDQAIEKANKLTKLCARGDEKRINELLGPTTSANGVVDKPASGAIEQSTSLTVQASSVQLELPQASQQDLLQQIKRGMRNPRGLDLHPELSQLTDEDNLTVVIEQWEYERPASLRKGSGRSFTPSDAEPVST